MTVTIYHNPACGVSRNTLAMIRQSGEEPVVIEYLKLWRDNLREKSATIRMILFSRGVGMIVAERQ